MSSLRAHLLRVTALSGAALSALSAHAGTPLPLWGFEGGTLGGWTSYGNATVVADDELMLGGKTFELGAKGDHMAKILPQGSVMRAQAEGLLGLTAGTFAGSGAFGLASSTNFGFITTTTHLDVGEYSFGWSYAAQDYGGFDDGVFFSVAGEGISSISVLAANLTGQADTVLVGAYGSTPWRVTSFTIATAGDYQISFGGYNNGDTVVDPILYLDDGVGSLTEDGVIVAPATPSAPVIDDQQPSHVISNVENGTLQPVFAGGTLLVDAAGTYDTDITINGQGGTIDSNGLDAELSGDIGGAGGLTKAGAGTLTLTGNNSYAGPTTVSGGSLVASSASLPGDVVNNATVEFAQASDGTYAGKISGSGNLVKSGAGKLILTGANDYSGSLTIAAGVIVGDTGSIKGNVTNNGALEFAQGTDGTFGGAISGSGGLTKSGAGTLTLTGANSYTGDTVIQQGKLVASSGIIHGNVVNNAALEFAQGADGTFGGAISGSGGLTKSGAGTLTLAGANSYTGDTVIQQGKLIANSGAIHGNIVNNATLEFAQASDGTLAGNIGGSGDLVKTGAGKLILAGSNSYTGMLKIEAGAIAGDTGSIKGNVANNGALEFAQGADGTFGGAISGSGGLTKSGAGTLTLAGANSYTGDTVVQQGKLIANSGAIHGNVVNNAALEFAQGADGTFGGAISGSGGLTKSGAGTLTLAGANSYTGDTVIQQGKLVASSGIIHGNVVNNGALEFAQGADGTFGGNISGSGTLTKSGAGALTLSGSNEGLKALVTGGTLVAGSQQAIGSTGGAIALSAGTGFQAGTDLTVSQSLAVLGTDAAIDTGAHTVVLAGGGSGNACLIKTGAGHLNLVSHFQNSIGACVQQGLMSFNNVFDGNVTVNSGAAMAGSGTVNGSIVASGTISPGNSPGVMVVNGSVTQLAGSTLALDIDGASAGNGAGHHDAVVLTGSGSVYTAAGLMAPTLRGISGDATNSFTPVLGQTFEVVTAEGGVTGSFEGITQPTEGMPANTRFDIIYRANSLLLVVTPGSYALMADTANAIAAGTALEALRPVAGVRSTAPVNPIFERLAGLDVAGIAQSLEQLSGSVHASTMDAALQGNRSTRANILQHLKVRRAIDEGVTPARGLWGSASKLSGGVDADGSGRGYRHESESYSIGFDIAPSADWTVGLAGTYAETRAKAGLLGDGKAEAYQVNLYAMWARSGSYATGQIGFGTTGYDIRRSITLNGATSSLAAAPDGSSLGAEAEAGHRFALGAIGLTPFVGVAYDRLSRDGVTETGDALIALQFGKAVRSAWAGRAGARLDSGNALAQGQLRAYASGALVTELGASRAAPMAALQGAGFRIAAANPGKTAFQGEAGLSGALSSAVRIDLGYRHLSSGSSHANSLNGTLRIRW